LSGNFENKAGKLLSMVDRVDPACVNLCNL